MDYRAVTWALQHSFKDAVHGGDHECAICKEAIDNESKELPCGHAFHLHCLRALLRSATGPARCPLCRATLVGGVQERVVGTWT